MSIEKKIFEDMKLAMKAGNKDELGTLRLLLAEIKDKRIDKREDLTEAEEAAVLTKAAKKRKEAIDIYSKSDRQQLAEKETFELNIISKYLPQQLTKEEITKFVSESLSNLNITGDKDLGRAMGVIMPKLKGKADGKLVQQVVRESISKLSQ